MTGSRLEAMLERLPPPLAIDPGSVIGDLLAVVDIALACDEEDVDRIQRSHWLDQAFDVVDLGRLGALFGIPPAPWEPLAMFRARLRAEVGALLSGSVSVAQLDRAVERIMEGARQALGLRFNATADIAEFPPATRRSPDLLARHGLVRTHDRFVLTNRGLDPAPAQVALFGVAGGGTAQPVVVNRTTGQASGWRGVVPAGRVLRLRSRGPGQTVTADLDGQDVTARVWSTAAFGPGAVVEDDPARPLVLVRNDNVLAVETLARYDDPGLDHAAYGVAGPALAQGRFGTAGGQGDDGNGGEGGDAAGTPFDDSVFVTGPVAAVDVWWTERQPAVFDVVVPWGAVARVARRRPEPEEDRRRVLELLASQVDRLRAAAVVGRVRDQRLTETHPAATDRLAVLAPVATTEVASAGQDRLAATSGQFDVTPRDQARFE